MNGEKIGEAQKIELSPLSRKEEVSRSFLQAWTKKFNERFKKSNDRESLVKGIAKLEGITTEQVEEKVKERRALVNEEEKPEDTFQEIAEKKGINSDKLKTSVERIKAKQEELISVLPQPPRKPLGTIINPRKSMTESNEIAGEKIQKLLQQNETEGEEKEPLVEKEEKTSVPTSISPATSKEAYEIDRLRRRIQEANEGEEASQPVKKQTDAMNRIIKEAKDKGLL